MLLSVTILASVLVTAILSGILGMAGGMILMAILVTLLPVAQAMALHGAVQAMSNGSRAWFLREHVRWGILPWYLAGSASALAIVITLISVPDAGVVLILVGLMPWLARALPLIGANLSQLGDVSRPVIAVGCGTTVTLAQLLAGASGPLLDLFYLHSRLNRHQIVATKALTQTVGHLLKLGYYGLLIAQGEALPAWLQAAAIIMAVVGSRIGTRLLDRVADEAFRRISGYVILTLGTLCALQGMHLLLQRS